MVKVFNLALAATAKRLSDVYGSGTGVVNDALNVPYRQILMTASGADAFIGDSTVSTSNGVKVAAAGVQPVSLGPFEVGPMKLSDLYAVGSGSTVQILGVPF